jgi:integrase
MRVLTLDESRRLLAAAEGDDLEAFYVLAATVGLRIGELLALQWRNVDLSRRRLTVVATLQKDLDGKRVLAAPKTAGSRRTVVLSALAVEALQRHRTRQIEGRLLVGQLYQDNDLVFANAFGKPLDQNSVREHSFARLLRRAGLPPMRFHALRHSAVSQLLPSGVPIRIVSEQAGHASINITLGTYGHVLETMQDTAADTMDKLFGKEAAQ